MTDFLELSIRLKDDDKTLVQKHAIYKDAFVLSRNNPELADLVNAAIAEFKGEPSDIVVRVVYHW